MLYRPLEPTPRRASMATRLAAAIGRFFAALRSRHADTAYIDGLREDEVAELGLRRHDERDFPSCR